MASHRMKKVDKVEEEGVVGDHAPFEVVNKGRCIVHMQYIEILVARHLPPCLKASRQLHERKGVPALSLIKRDSRMQD